MRFSSKQASILTIVVLAAAIGALQLWGTVKISQQGRLILEDLSSIQAQRLSTEHEREELISLKLKNQLQTYFWQSLLSALGPTITALVAIIGALLGLRKYLDTREKDRLGWSGVGLQPQHMGGRLPKWPLRTGACLSTIRLRKLVFRWFFWLIRF